MAQFVPVMRPELMLRQRSIWRAPICVHEARRAFAISHRNSAKTRPGGAGAQAVGSMIANKKQPNQPHFKNQVRDQMAKLKDPDQIPNDLGLLPETFIMPSGKNLPSLFKDPKFRLGLEWRRIKRRFIDLASTYTAYKFFLFNSLKGIKKPKRPTIDYRTILPIAKRLHLESYTAFAEGSPRKIHKLCTESLESSYLSRIAKRLQNQERLHWELVKYLSEPKVVSMKAGGTPLKVQEIPVGVQQAVVRIESRQRLTSGKVARGTKGSLKKDADNVTWGEPREKDVTEYIVVQRRLMLGKWEPWMVWGYVKEFDAMKEKDELDRALQDKMEPSR